MLFKQVSYGSIGVQFKKRNRLERLLWGTSFEDIEEVQFISTKLTANILSWILKCIKDPEGDKITFKYHSALTYLQEN